MPERLVATIQIRNVGSSRVDFDREASGLIFYEYTTSPAATVHAVTDERVTSFPVFETKQERYVEPKEDIEVQRLISLPVPLKLAYRLEAEILSTSGFIWRASSIVDKSSLRDNAADLIGL